MKIIQFTHGYLPVYGGTTVRNLNLFKNNRHSIYMISDLKKDKVNRRDVFKNVIVNRYPVEKIKMPRPLPRLEFYHDFQVVRAKAEQLADQVKEKKFDIIHGHNPAYCALAAAKLARKTNKPFIYESHSFFPAKELLRDKHKKNLSSYILNYLRLWLVQFKEGLAAREAGAVIVQTPDLKRKLSRAFGIDRDKIHIVPNGVDTKLFDPKKWSNKVDAFRKKKNWNKKIIFMYSGFLDRPNGVDVLAKTFTKLPEKIKKKIKLVIFGRGYLEDDLKKIAKKNRGLIDFLTPVSYYKMPLYYAACDVFVIPRPSITATETVVPLKLIEAAAMEKIILVSSVKGLQKIVKNNQSGIVFNKNDQKDLEKKIKDIVSNYKKYNHLGKEARKIAIREHDWGRSRKKLNKIYQDLIYENQ